MTALTKTPHRPLFAVLLSFSLALTATTARASTAHAAIPPSIQDIAGTTNLYGVACSSASTCYLVGYANPSGSDTGVIVPVTNGNPGQPITVAGTFYLLGIACANSATCYAVGYNNTQQGVIVPISDGVPGTVEVVPGTTALEDVVCSTTASCTAVGWVVAGNVGSGVVVSITNGAIAGAQDAPGTDELLGIACATSDTCYGVGLGQSGDGAAGVVTAMTNGTPTGTTPVPGTDQLRGVACATSSTCYAVGQTEDITNYQITGDIVTITDGTASSPQAVARSLYDNGLFGVACEPTYSCYAVGDDGVIVPITNGTQGTAQQVTPSAVLYRDACTTTGTCYAAGSDNGDGALMNFDVPSTTGQPPSITSTDATTFPVDQPSSFTVTTTATPTATITESGTLPGGVTFADHGNGTATLAGTPVLGSVGNYQLLVTATNGIAPAASQPFILTVSQAASTTTLKASPDPSYYGQPVSFTATVTSSSGTPTGSVSFYLDAHASPMATITLTAGHATYRSASLPPGTHYITADYNGDINFITSTSATLTQTVKCTIALGSICISVY